MDGCLPSLCASVLQPFKLVGNRPRRTTGASFSQGALEVCQVVLDGFQDGAVHRGKYDRYGNLEYRLIGERCEKGWYRFGPFMPRNLPLVLITEQRTNFPLAEAGSLAVPANVIMCDLMRSC